MRTVALGISLVCAWVAVGCTSTPPPHSCATSAGCAEWIAATYPIDERAYCDSVSGSYSTTVACPTAGRVARCTQTFGGPGGSVTIRVNYYAPTTTLEARNSCPPPMAPAGWTYEFQEG